MLINHPVDLCPLKMILPKCAKDSSAGCRLPAACNYFLVNTVRDESMVKCQGEVPNVGEEKPPFALLTCFILPGEHWLFIFSKVSLKRHLCVI